MLAAILLVFSENCAVTSLEPDSLSRGRDATYERMISDLGRPGIIGFQRIVGGDWSIAREGLIDLEDPNALEAGLEEGLEPIHIYFYVLDHPTQGRFLIDTGMGQVFKEPSDRWPISSIVQSQMNMDTLKIRTTTADWLKSQDREVQGVLLTHMHMDHILGSGDIESSVPFYTGPHEATAPSFLNLFVRGTTDDLLQGKRLVELQFPVSSESAEGEEASEADETAQEEPLNVIDFFGDGSLFVIHVPGHTPGSMAFLINGKDGIHFVLGDTCHTAWGWEHNVVPGSFTANHDDNRHSLNELQKLAHRLTIKKIYPGHQNLD